MSDIFTDTQFRLACRMLRQSGVINPPLGRPIWKRSESAIDFMVHAGLAKSPRHAAKALLVALDLLELHSELQAIEEISSSFN